MNPLASLPAPPISVMGYTAPAQPIMSPGSISDWLENAPATGLPVTNLIDYADTNVTSLNVNLWLVGAAIGIFVLAAMFGGRR